MNKKHLVPIFELFAKGIAFFTIILMTHVLSIEDMGNYSLAVTIVMMASVFMDGGVTNKAYISLLKNNAKEVAELFSLKMVFSFISIICLSIYSYVNYEFWLVIVIYVAITFFISIISFYKITYRAREVIKWDIVCILVDPIAKVIVISFVFFVHIDVSLDELLLVFLATSIVEYVFIRFVFNRENDFVFFKKISLSKFFYKLNNLKYFILYYFLYIFLQRVDVFYISHYMSKNDVASYFAAFNIYAALILFVAALGTTVFPKVKDKSMLFIILYFKWWFLLYLFLLVIAILTIPFIYPFIYPEQYLSGESVLIYFLFSLPFVLINYLLMLKNNFNENSFINTLSVTCVVIGKVLILAYIGMDFKTIDDYGVFYVFIEVAITSVYLIVMFTRKTLESKLSFTINDTK